MVGKDAVAVQVHIEKGLIVHAEALDHLHAAHVLAVDDVQFV